MVRIEPFSEEHADEVASMCAAEGWPSWTRDSTSRALSGPGVLAVVAIDRGSVVGVAEMLWDGEIMGYLAQLLVSASARERGVGRALVADLFVRSGAERMDVLAESDATSFYESLPHKVKPGFRLYRND